MPWSWPYGPCWMRVHRSRARSSCESRKRSTRSGSVCLLRNSRADSAAMKFTFRTKINLTLGAGLALLLLLGVGSYTTIKALLDDPDVARLIGMMLDKEGFDADREHATAILLKAKTSDEELRSTLMRILTR